MFIRESIKRRNRGSKDATDIIIDSFFAATMLGLVGTKNILES